MEKKCCIASYMKNQTRVLQQSFKTIIRVFKIMETNVTHENLDLKPAEIQTLQFIGENPGSMSAALAEHLGVVPTTATSIVDRLVKRGYIDRTRPESNRRAVALALTKEGQKSYDLIETEELEMFSRILGVLDEKERNQFVKTTAKVAEKLLDIKK